MTLNHKLLHLCQEQRMTRPGDTLVLAVSGGMDSMCLLYLMHALRVPLGVRLVVAHYDHHVRLNSRRDRDLVCGAAQQLGLPFVEGRRPGRVIKKLSEDKLRQLRVAFLQETVRQQKAQAIMTAHHGNDLAETVLMRILRSTGLSGLRGMSVISKWGDVQVLRPLLKFSRQDLQDYVKQQRIPYHHDESNDDVAYLRNQVRQELIPFIEKKYEKQITAHLIALAMTASMDYDYMESQTKLLMKKHVHTKAGAVRIKIQVLKNMHPALIAMTLRMMMQEIEQHYTPDLIHTQRLVEAVMQNKQGIQELPQGIRIQLGPEWLLCTRV